MSTALALCRPDNPYLFQQVRFRRIVATGDKRVHEAALSMLKD